MTTLNDELEALVDSHSLNEVIEALQNVCYAKAEHLEANWQDAKSAKAWLKAARGLDGLRGVSI